MANKKQAAKQPANSNGSKVARGRPFKKGQSGNPKGRPRTGLAAAELVRKIGDETIEGGAVRMTRIEAVLRRMYQAAFAGDVRAATTLLDRGWGKPAQPIEASGPDGMPTELVIRYVYGLGAVATGTASGAGDDPE